MKLSKKKKIFLGVVLFLILSFAGTFFALNKLYKDNILIDKKFSTIMADGIENSEEHKDRINVLVLGMEHTRTDMIMVASFDPKTKTLNTISIPRDTYVENTYSDPTLKKINAVYEYPSEDGGVERLGKEVSNILGIPITDYVKVDYNAVAQITDAVGGVDVYVPFNMYYDDPYSDPPLHIHFQKGNASLNGKNAVEYLRWRKNNDGTHGNDGDIGRVERQQDFIKKVLEKSLNPTMLPKLIEVGLENVETSLTLPRLMALVTDAVNMPSENIHFYQTVGSPSYFNQLWYYVTEKDKTRNLISKIMLNQYISELDTNPSESFVINAENGFGHNSNSYTRNENNYTSNNSETKQSVNDKQDVVFNNDNKQDPNVKENSTNIVEENNNSTESTQTNHTITENTNTDINHTVVDTPTQIDNTNTEPIQSNNAPAQQNQDTTPQIQESTTTTPIEEPANDTVQAENPTSSPIF